MKNIVNGMPNCKKMPFYGEKCLQIYKNIKAPGLKHVIVADHCLSNCINHVIII